MWSWRKNGHGAQTVNRQQQRVSVILKDNSISVFAAWLGERQGEEGWREGLVTHGVGVRVLATVCLAIPSAEEQNLDRLQCPPRAATHPTSCCCPATAVSVFYYDFLRLSFSRPRGSSGGPSVSLLPFSCSQKQSTHRHVCTHTPHRATTESSRTTKNRNQKWTSPTHQHSRDLEQEAAEGGARGWGGGVLRKLYRKSVWQEKLPERHPNCLDKTTGFLPRRALFCFVFT